jgi:prepilin-type processing-associated H-X9-DG protein
MNGSIPRAARGGFTLIHLLIVIIILAFLAAMLMPSLCRSSEQANRIRCASNLKAVGYMIATYQNENGGHFPRTVAEAIDNPVPTFYTGAAARQPFGPDGPAPNDITAAIYLLLRTQDTTGEILICPSSANERTTQPLQETSNFPDASGLSYSFQNPYTRSSNPAVPNTQPLSGPADFALAADINPGGKPLLTTPADARRAEIVRINSPNHAGDGENVLYADGHVDWSATPFAGMERKVDGRTIRDNIYLAGGPGTPAAAAIEAAPADGDDNILLPVSPTGPASGAIAVQRVGGVREIVWVYAAVALAVGMVGLAVVIRIRRRRRANSVSAEREASDRRVDGPAGRQVALHQDE